MGTMKTIFRRNTCRTRISYNITFKLKNKIKNPFPDFYKTTTRLRIRLATSFHSTLIAKSAFQKWNPEIHPNKRVFKAFHLCLTRIFTITKGKSNKLQWGTALFGTPLSRQMSTKSNN